MGKTRKTRPANYGKTSVQISFWLDTETDDKMRNTLASASKVLKIPNLTLAQFFALAIEITAEKYPPVVSALTPKPIAPPAPQKDDDEDDDYDDDDSELENRRDAGKPDDF